MEKHLEALKAELDKLSEGMSPSKSFKDNTAAFQAASVAFHEFIRNGINECGGDIDYLPEANVLSRDIGHSFTAGEMAADAKEPYEAPHSTMDLRTQGMFKNRPGLAEVLVFGASLS